MRKAATIALVLALSGCATMENRLATYILSRYVGVWEKAGATDDDRDGAVSDCFLQQQTHQHGMVVIARRPARTVFLRGYDLDEKAYRDCMTAKGWKLAAFEVK